MKKHLLKSLLALALVLITGNVWGETISFDPNTDKATSEVKTLTKEGITITVTDGTLGNGTDYRVYKSQTMTITSANGVISEIALTYSSASYDGGGWKSSYQPNSETWTSPTTNGEQARITKIEVTIGPANSLTSIAVSGEPTKTTYEAGEEFDPTGLIVTGTYDDSSTDEITSGITWDVTPSGALTAGTTSVSVTATVSGITSAEYTVSGLTVTAALPKITITASSIENFGGSYEKRSWNAGGVSGECYAYRAGSNAPYLMQFNETPYVYNTTAIPGRILSIEIIKGGGTDRAWSVYCAEAPLTSKTDGTQIGTAQTVSTSYKWNVPSETNYNYFYITKGSSSTQISEIIITYEAKTLVNIAVSGNPTTTTYTAGETFDPAGLVVTGTYDDNSQKEITTGIEWTFNPATLSEGQTSVSVTATVDDISSDSYTVNGLTVNAAKVLTGIEVAGTPAEFWKGETFNHTGMTVTARYSNADDEDVTNEATFSTPDMTTAGKKTVTVTYSGKETSYEIEVKTIANTQETAYTVAQAIALIDAGKDIATEVYVKGTVSSIPTAWSTQYNNITYNISDDGETSSQQFQLYRCATNGAAVGDEVIAKGMMTKYGNTYEFSAGNTIVYSVKVATLSIADITVEIDGDITPTITTNVVAGYTVAYTSDNEEVVLAVDDEMVTMGIGTATITAILTAEGYKTVQTTFTVEVIKALNSIAVKTAPATTEYKAGDKFNPAGLVITLAYSDASTEDVAYAGNEDKFTFEPSLTTALTTSNTSVAITYAEKETTQTISVRALYTYTITWMANGVKFDETEVTEDDALALPTTNPANVADMVFMGWAAEEVTDGEEPEYVASTIVPEEDATYYAVYAKETAGETTSVTKDIIADGGLVASVTLNADNNPYQMGELPITLTGIKGTSNFPAINVNSTSGTDLRFYKGTTCGVTFATTNGQPITKIEFKKNETANSTLSGCFSVNVGTLSDNVWTGSANSVTFTYEGTGTFKEQMYIINVTYSETTPSTYSDYCTRFHTVTIAASGKSTLYLDYAVAVPDGVKAYYATGFEDGVVTMNEVDGKIAANQGVMLMGTGGTKYTFVETTGADVPETNFLKGNPESTDLTASGYYILSNGKFVRVTGGTLAADKAYLDLKGTQNTTIGFRFGDATQIESVNAVENGKYYDLMGREVLIPSNGIYILNGKKVLVK